MKTLDDRKHTHTWRLVDSISNDCLLMKCNSCKEEAFFVFNGWKEKEE